MDQAVVAAVLEDYRTAPIDERLRATLGFLHKLTLEPQGVEASDIAQLRAAGVEDRAAYEAMYVCFVFNVIDRLADAFGYIVRDAKHQQRTAKLLVLFGYWSAALPE